MTSKFVNDELTLFQLNDRIETVVCTGKEIKEVIISTHIFSNNSKYHEACIRVEEESIGGYIKLVEVEKELKITYCKELEDDKKDYHMYV